MAQRTLVTGASGYLGGRLLEFGCVAVPRGQYGQCAGQVVIHCAAVVPKTDAEANDTDDARVSVQLVRDLIAARPRRIVFPSTRTGGGAYLDGKREAERLLLESGIPARVIRLPGLFGPPRAAGLVFNVIRALQRGESFTPEKPLREWTGMHVQRAAMLCLAASAVETTGMAEAHDDQLEELLAWVRQSS